MEPAAANTPDQTTALKTAKERSEWNFAYSITSSARSMIDCGTLSPSVLFVARWHSVGKKSYVSPLKKDVLQDNGYREKECAVLTLIRVEKEHVGPEGGASDLVTFGLRVGAFVDFEITVRMSGRLSEEILVTDAKSLVREAVAALHSRFKEQYRNNQYL